ncbi:YadA C-terminal domain-containing protein [Morganella morganii]|nr:YadA C-terminal domain-containing protein [Morganella morganii]
MSVVNGKVDKIDYEANTKEQDDKIEANTESLIKETEQREAQHITLVTQVNQIGATGDYAVYQAGLANEAAAANRVALESTNARIAHNTTLLNKHTVQISALEHNMNSRFSVLDNKINDNRKRASAAISGVAAMANIPQVTDTQRFTVGAGVGTTDSESALAVGFSARATESVVIKASVSTDTQSNFVVGAGASYGW